MNTDSFKRMFRLIDCARRNYINHSWGDICKGKSAGKLSSRHIYYLTLIRQQLPCNLNTVMQITGLSSSAASTFIEKLVQAEIVTRKPNEEDRRNVQIIPTPETLQIFQEVDRRLDRLIDFLAQDCTPEEIEAIDRTGELVCRKITMNRHWIEENSAPSATPAGIRYPIQK
ncbi:MAG: MarR family transcriptional regulator [Thermoguttaceae bacterium]|nr:MarR family transcriptional regulator [Thermoguttaceae bacterium]MBP3694796.1 MarR family transcriptional regulator [Thermoguttaceae bacterium]